MALPASPVRDGDVGAAKTWLLEFATGELVVFSSHHIIHLHVYHMAPCETKNSVDLHWFVLLQKENTKSFISFGFCGLPFFSCFLHCSLSSFDCNIKYTAPDTKMTKNWITFLLFFLLVTMVSFIFFFIFYLMNSSLCVIQVCTEHQRNCYFLKANKFKYSFHKAESLLPYILHLFPMLTN